MCGWSVRAVQVTAGLISVESGVRGGRVMFKDAGIHRSTFSCKRREVNVMKYLWSDAHLLNHMPSFVSRHLSAKI